MFEPSITKESVNELPICTYTGKIEIVDTLEKCRQAVDLLCNEPVIGFDTETRPSFKKGVQHKVSLLQLATLTHCFLFRINQIGVPQELVDLLQDKKTLKIGVAIDNDKTSLRKLRITKFDGFVDLQKTVGKFGIQELSLQKMYAIVFGKKISKSQRLSNWEASELSIAQQEYAAMDAKASLEIYLKLMKEQ